MENACWGGGGKKKKSERNKRKDEEILQRKVPMAYMLCVRYEAKPC